MSWTAPSDNGAAIDDYDVRYRTGGGSWTELPDTVKSTSTTATITGLTNGTAYEVQVRAGNSVGDGAWSASATGTPVAAAVPSAPSAPSLTAGDGQLGVSWTAPSDNGAAIDDYDLRYRTGGGSWTELPDAVKSTSTTATITGLTNGTAYEVQVRAGNSAGDGEWSASATGTPAAATSEDRAALVEFYNATNGANWGNNTNWNSSAPLDQWYGVFTNVNGRVRRLLLSDNQLTGSIPSSLGSLTNLERLYLNDNQLTGSIPSSLGSLTNLRSLLLNFNQLTGSIPSSLGSLTNLRDLWLQRNQLTGSIPSSMGSLTNLEELILSDNQLTGSIPSSMGSLTNLQKWYLYNNQLTGSIPSSLGSLTNLEELILSDNQLTGSIPSSLGSLTNLQKLWLDNNQLTGSIPSSLGSLTNLEELILFDNQLTGSIPSSLGSLTNLEDLILSDNQLTGSIPSSLGSLTNLQAVDLHDNQLTGSIPSSLGSLTNLTRLDLRYNQLTGSIPAALCRFTFSINPQQGGVDLPCSESDTVGALEARLVPGDGQLTVDWTAPSGDGAPIDDYDVRYRADAESDAWTELPDATKGTATSATITGLTNGTAYQVQVRARAGDGEWSATVTGAPAAPAERLTFGEARIEDQRFRQHAAIAPLVLPAATGGEGLLNYALSPALPAGLVFDAATRTLSGAPSVATAASTWTYTATDGAASPEQASLSFAIEVEVSAEEAALRRDALAAQGRALLSSVTGVIGERFRPRQAASLEVGGGARGAGRALGEALASMFGSWSSQGRVGGAGGAAFARGVGTAGHAARVGGGLDDLSGVGGASGFVGPSAAGSDVGLGGLWASGAGRFDGALPGMGPGSPGIGGGGWDGGLWGRSFAAPLATGEDGVGASRYTVWGAGDRQSFSGAPEQGRYSGDVRSFYVGADRRLGNDWLAGAAVGRSWGAAGQGKLTPWRH